MYAAAREAAADESSDDDLQEHINAALGKTNKKVKMKSKRAKVDENKKNH